MNDDWPFDQAKNVAAITTRQVLDEHHSIPIEEKLVVKTVVSKRQGVITVIRA
ncbi:hypothetical protein [Adonisia turfae]|uniref:hypothetical protein n=1 Tax=Adonisia turfae TaxID=2950184 RepID=UPI0013D44803|nr:hypothetical protein [Adonisia turfae]